MGRRIASGVKTSSDLLSATLSGPSLWLRTALESWESRPIPGQRWHQVSQARSGPQAHRDADSRFEAAHVVAEIEVVENILDDLRVELLRLHCDGAVEDVLGREVEPEVHRNGHDEDESEGR